MHLFDTSKKKQLDKLRNQFGTKSFQTKSSIEDISVYYNMTKDQLPFRTIDDITWNDLDMDRIFERMNHTSCYIGEQTLYRHLHILSEKPEQLNSLEDMTQFLSENEEERLELQYAMSAIGKSHEDYYLPMFLFNSKDLSISHVWVYRLLQVLLFISLAAGIMLDSIICFGVTVFIAAINIIIYSINKTKYESYLFSLISTKYMVIFAQKLLKKDVYREKLDVEKLQTAVKELHKLTHLIGNFQSKKSSMWTGEVFDLVRDYIIGATLWDLTIFKKITNIIYGKLDYLLEVYEFVGKIDMAISIASFRKSLPYFCLPLFCEKKEINMEQVYHPLLDAPIGNSLLFQDSCIITGSNASGKSTFIKAVAINTILAQSINTCMAECFYLPRIHVMTSMTIRDDIQMGESYYIRELKNLKRITDNASFDVVTLCIVDEILKGTNTQERLASSEAILKYLADRNCFVIVATHDMELAKTLNGTYKCLHFRNYIENDKIVFDYKIHDGYSQTQNAIRLLHHIGFPESITKMAEEICLNIH